MRKVIIIVIIVAVFASVTAFVVLSGKNNKTGNNKQTASVSAPDFSELDLFGKDMISLKSYSNKVILLNFWATWCPPCKAEIPDLIRLYNQYKGKFIIIGISVDQTGADTVREFYKNYKMNYPVIMATSGILQNYGGITAIPTSFLISPDGKLIKTIVGYRSKDQYEAEIKPYLPK